MAQAKITWTGVAREATSGTAMTDPTLFMPVSAKFQNRTKYVYVNEDRNTREVNNDRVGTVRMAQGTLDGSVYVDTFPYLLLAHMGAVASSQPDAVHAAAIFKHALTLADVPPSLTLFKGYDTTDKYTFAYSVVDKVSIKFTADGKLLEHSSSVQSQFKVPYTNTPTVSFANTPKPLAGYTPTIKFNTVASTDVTDMQIDLTQKVTLFYPAAGSRAFAKVYFGDRTATVKFNARFDTNTLLESAFVSETDQAIDVTIINPFDESNNSSGIHQQVHLNFPIVGMDTADVAPTGDYWNVAFAGTVRPGAVKNSLYTADVQNKVTSYAS